MTEDVHTAGPVDETPTGWRPALVGLSRAVLEAAVVAALGVIAAAVTALNLGEWNVAIPTVLLAVRTVEGIADDRIDPTVQRGRLGGTPAR